MLSLFSFFSDFSFSCLDSCSIDEIGFRSAGVAIVMDVRLQAVAVSDLLAPGGGALRFH